MSIDEVGRKYFTKGDVCVYKSQRVCLEANMQ